MEARFDNRPERVVVFTMAQPPGGGKSSFFHALQGAFANSNVNYCYRSSDDFKNRQTFEAEFKRCVQGCTSQRRHTKISPKGEPGPPTELIVVGYDKPISNIEDLKRLLQLLFPVVGVLISKFRLRLVAVVPDKGSFDVCSEFHNSVAEALFTTVTDAFFAPHSAGIPNPMFEFASDLCDKVLANEIGTPLIEVCDWVNHQNSHTL